MKSFEHQLRRLEERLNMKRPRHFLIHNFADGNSQEFLPGLFIDVIGEPLSQEELEQLRQQYLDRRQQKPVDESDDEI